MNILKQGSVGDTSGKSKEEDENVTAFTTFAGPFNEGAKDTW